MRPSYKNVIHIEGMDLAGKSTATNALAETLGATITRNSLVERNDIFRLADDMRRAATAGPATMGHLYVAALHRDLELVHRPTRPAIQDSTILLRSAAYYAVRSETAIVEALSATVPRHPEFGATFVLTASLTARSERLRARQKANPDEVAPDDLAVIDDPGRFLATEVALVDFACHWFDATVIDTSALTPGGVVDRILNHLGRV